MRGLVRSAVQTSNAVARNTLKKEVEEKKAAKQEKKAKRKADNEDDDVKGSDDKDSKSSNGKGSFLMTAHASPPTTRWRIARAEVEERMFKGVENPRDGEDTLGGEDSMLHFMEL